MLQSKPTEKLKHDASILNRARMRWRLRYGLGRLQRLHQDPSLSNWWNLTGTQYINEIIQPLVTQGLWYIGGGAVFQDSTSYSRDGK